MTALARRAADLRAGIDHHIRDRMHFENRFHEVDRRICALEQRLPATAARKSSRAGDSKE
jgi:hypothetical protein